MLGGAPAQRHPVRNQNVDVWLCSDNMPTQPLRNCIPISSSSSSSLHGNCQWPLKLQWLRAAAAPCRAQVWWSFIIVTVVVTLFVEPYNLAFSEYPGL